jgi:hypothetical protein
LWAEQAIGYQLSAISYQLSGISLKQAATLIVHVVPRSRTTEIAGQYGDAIRIRLAAPPVDGAANAELIRFLADRLGVARQAVTIVRGDRGRRKTITIDGVTQTAIQELLIADS